MKHENMQVFDVPDRRHVKSTVIITMCGMPRYQNEARFQPEIWTYILIIYSGTKHTSKQDVIYI